MSAGFAMLLDALLLGGIGSRTQHPIASALVARAFAGPASLKAIGAYNFAGDLGKMTAPALLSLMLLVIPWRPALFIWVASALPSPSRFCSRRRVRTMRAKMAARQGAQSSMGRTPSANSSRWRSRC
jgi:MFS family permease